MLVGAVIGFWSIDRIHVTSSIALAIGVVLAAAAGALMASIHAFLVITMRASQIVSGLALTIFAGAVGLSSYLGNDLNLAGVPATHTFTPIFPSSMQNWPVVGPILFGQDLLVYASWALVLALIYYLNRTRYGLNVRAVGESPGAADAMGISVPRYRYVHTIAGGALAGVAGATFTLAITPQWVDGITGGAGWIAIALVDLRLLAPRAVPRRRVLLRRVAGARARAPGAPDQSRPDGALDERAPLHRDDRGARDRVGEQREAPAGRARGARRRLHARGPLAEPDGLARGVDVDHASRRSPSGGRASSACRRTSRRSTRRPCTAAARGPGSVKPVGAPISAGSCESERCVLAMQIGSPPRPRRFERARPGRARQARARLRPRRRRGVAIAAIFSLDRRRRARRGTAASGAAGGAAATTASASSTAPSPPRSKPSLTATPCSAELRRESRGRLDLGRRVASGTG